MASYAETSRRVLWDFLLLVPIRFLIIAIVALIFLDEGGAEAEAEASSSSTFLFWITWRFCLLSTFTSFSFCCCSRIFSSFRLWIDFFINIIVLCTLSSAI
ncbi:hypothetical protein EDD21DRAFT_393694 [Dissophora ornata]|nr:hypothetical protein EDD21DRAFT_393694 [Dissophora ornata]